MIIKFSLLGQRCCCCCGSSSSSSSGSSSGGAGPGSHEDKLAQYNKPVWVQTDGIQGLHVPTFGEEPSLEVAEQNFEILAAVYHSMGYFGPITGTVYADPQKFHFIEPLSG